MRVNPDCLGGGGRVIKPKKIRNCLSVLRINNPWRSIIVRCRDIHLYSVKCKYDVVQPVLNYKLK